MFIDDQRSPEGGIGLTLRAAADVIAAVVAAFEPERYSGADARTLVERFSRIERLGAAGKALAARRVAETDAWRGGGARSAADWLGRTTGTTAGQAAQTLSTSQQLRDQPEVDAAVRAGALSSTQATEIANATKDAPNEAARLIDRAKSDSVQGLRQDCQAVKAASAGEDAGAHHRRIHARRYLRSWIDQEGAGRLDARMTADALARLRAELAPFEHAEFEAARRQGRTEPNQAYALDALLSAVDTASGGNGDDSISQDNRFPGRHAGVAGERAADDDRPPGAAGSDERPTGEAAGADPNTAGDGGPAGDDAAGDSPASDDAPAGETAGSDPKPAERATPRLLRPPATVIVRIDHAALLRGATRAGECCEIDGVGPVPVEVVRAMMADAFLAAVVTDGVDIRSVAHLGRSVTATQRTALFARDPECVVPGCHVRTRLEIDHVQGWAATRVTRLDELARLCHHHHSLKTHEGWILRGPPGHWTFSRKGDHHDATPARPPPAPSGAPTPGSRRAAPSRPRPRRPTSPTSPDCSTTNATL